MADFSNLGFTSNPYLDQQIGAANGDLAKSWNMVQQPAFNKAMVNSGSFGNSGVQQMNQYGQEQLQNAMGRQANDMRSNNFWQGMGFDQNNYWQNQNFDRGVYNDTFAQNQQQFQNGINMLNMGNTANQQNLGFGQQIQNAPMNYYQGFSNIANSMGQGYGNSTTQMNAQGSPLMGALGGAQLGSTLANQFGWGTPNYGFTGAGTPNMSGSSGGNGGFTLGGTTYNNPSAYSA